MIIWVGEFYDPVSNSSGTGLVPSYGQMQQHLFTRDNDKIHFTFPKFFFFFSGSFPLIESHILEALSAH